jgi:hypothetical protein
VRKTGGVLFKINASAALWYPKCTGMVLWIVPTQLQLCVIEMKMMFMFIIAGKYNIIVTTFGAL